jgi:hypothetical protein
MNQIYAKAVWEPFSPGQAALGTNIGNHVAQSGLACQSVENKSSSTIIVRQSAGICEITLFLYIEITTIASANGLP